MTTSVFRTPVPDGKGVAQEDDTLEPTKGRERPGTTKVTSRLRQPENRVWVTGPSEFELRGFQEVIEGYLWV